MTTPSLHGRPLDSLRDRLGSWQQIARVEQFTATDGPAQGARRIRLVTGGGLDIDVHPDRGLDLGQASIDGIPVAWISSTGFPGGWRTDGRGAGWLDTFGGGLLATCGLRNIGVPSVDGDEEFGMHGAIGSRSAAVTRAEVADGLLVVEGEVSETSVFGDELVLRRRLSAEVGGRGIRIEDRVRNEGTAPAAILLLHHLNLGWPLVDEGTTVDVPASSVEPRDADSAEGLEGRGRIEAPDPGTPDRVFLHRFDTPGSRAVVTNPGLGLAAEITSTLPYLFQWSSEHSGSYVLGIEPSNTPTLAGRAAAREAAVLEVLAPGEDLEYTTTVAFVRR